MSLDISKMLLTASYIGDTLITWATGFLIYGNLLEINLKFELQNMISSLDVLVNRFFNIMG